MNLEQANKLGGALHRLQELRNAKVILPDADAERRGLEKYLAEELPKHAADLIGAWFVIHTEYDPLVRGVRSLLMRATPMPKHIPGEEE